MYSKARTRIRSTEGPTKFFHVTQGVLQGEILSPLLFILFVSDIDKFVDDQNCSPVSLGNQDSVHMLMLADDNVILAEGRTQLQAKINALQKYFDLNGLEVNLRKTTVIKYRRKGKLCKNDKFFYKRQEIEIVKNYMYLGIQQCSSGLFNSACTDRIVKARAAMGAALSTCRSANLYSFDARIKLFDAVVANSLL